MLSERIIWICAACGKYGYSRDFGDTSCFTHAIPCKESDVLYSRETWKIISTKAHPDETKIRDNWKKYK